MNPATSVSAPVAPQAEAAAVGPLVIRLLDHVADAPVMVFSRSGELLAATAMAAALTGHDVAFARTSRHVADTRLTAPGDPGSSLVEVLLAYHGVRRYQHPDLGPLELHGHFLVDPLQQQLVLVFVEAAGSTSEQKLRVLAEGLR